MAVDAVECVAYKTRRVGTGVEKNLFAAPDNLAHRGVRNVARTRWFEEGGCQTGRHPANARVGHGHHYIVVALGGRLGSGGQVGQPRAVVYFGRTQRWPGGLLHLRFRVIAFQLL